MQVGDLVVTPISDGTFIARPAYFGDDATADGHGDLFDRHGQAWLPIGCFLVRSGDRCVLVDAGTSSVPTCTPDHVGWLFDQESRPTFPNATIWFGAGDWRHFIEPATRSSSTTSTKALLLGDAVTCPVQLDEATWHSIGDVDPGLAIRTRDRLCRELEATTSPAQEPTFRSSGSDVCSAAAASAGGRDLGRPRR